MDGRRFRLATVFLAAIGISLQIRTVHGQVPGGLISTPTAAASSPYQTFWKFLGFRQEYRRLYDGTVNRNGNHPSLERKPPLKAIGDPENLTSKNPAIKRAAEVKFEEDLAMQKVKAIKYLSKIGCGCYPGVKEALMASLDDCTEFVRYEACKAIAEAAVSKCSTCNKACCCDEELSKKLAKMAWEKDEEGCCFERSARVREAAREAVNACCCAKHGYGDPQPPTPVVKPDVQQKRDLEVIPTPKVLPRETVPESSPKAPEQPPKNATNKGTNPGTTRSVVTLPPMRKTLTSNPPPSPSSAHQIGQDLQTSWVSDETKTQIRQATATIERRELETMPSTQREKSAFNSVSKKSSSSQSTTLTPNATPPSRSAAASAKSPKSDGASKVVTISDSPLIPVPKGNRISATNDSRHASVKFADQPTQSEQYVRVCGQVLAVNNECGIVTAEFCRTPRPKANDIAKVFHDYLCTTECSGAFSIVSVQNSIVTMRPMGDGLLGKVSLGDCVVCDVRSSHSRGNEGLQPEVKGASELPPVPPSTATSKPKRATPSPLPPAPPQNLSSTNNFKAIPSALPPVPPQNLSSASNSKATLSALPQVSQQNLSSASNNKATGSAFPQVSPQNVSNASNNKATVPPRQGWVASP